MMVVVVVMMMMEDDDDDGSLPNFRQVHWLLRHPGMT